MNTFPIPVVGIGPGSQIEEDELTYMQMPQGMQTYTNPILPEPEDILSLKQAHAVLREIHLGLQRVAQGEHSIVVDLSHLDAANLQLVNQVLGEGEVSARIEAQYSMRIQEAVFTGVWRTVISDGVTVISDHIEIGRIPSVLVSAAQQGVQHQMNTPMVLPEQLPFGVMNAPSIVTELNDKIATWETGMPAHVINLTLLPLSPEDVTFLEQQLAGGTVLILSRGYGNCRILSTVVPHCWRVVYYNSSDALLLNTIEVTDIPEVACAAREDIEDSCERLAEVLAWVEQQ
jgi:hydrogenase-1 operon protein HyaF